MQSVVSGHQSAVNHQTIADNQKSAAVNKTPECDDEVGTVSECRLFIVRRIAVKLLVISFQTLSDVRKARI